MTVIQLRIDITLSIQPLVVSNHYTFWLKIVSTPLLYKHILSAFKCCYSGRIEHTKKPKIYKNVMISILRNNERGVKMEHDSGCFFKKS